VSKIFIGLRRSILAAFFELGSLATADELRQEQIASIQSTTILYGWHYGLNQYATENATMGEEEEADLPAILGPRWRLVATT